jgi:hypothetical protein
MSGWMMGVDVGEKVKASEGSGLEGIWAKVAPARVGGFLDPGE